MKLNKKIKTSVALLASAFLLASCAAGGGLPSEQKSPVDYVNPYMGNISHLLVPTYPTVHLPNSMLRVYPERADFTGDMLSGLPVIVTSHRGSSAFNLSPYQGEESGLKPVINYSYDHEKIYPYRYQVYLDDNNIDVDFAPSHQSAVYGITFEGEGPAYLIFNSRNGQLKSDGKSVSGYQFVDRKTKVYLYAETDKAPQQCGVLGDNTVKYGETSVEGKDAALVLSYGNDVKKLGVRYGISFISEDQAKKNLEREIAAYDVDVVAKIARNDWNDALGKIQTQGGTNDDKTVFYTSLYRCYERPVNLSEDGRYYSAFDGQIHEDGGRPFYTDDWIWDTYRATHPLRILIDNERESDIINSFLLMAEQMGTNWMPTFPEVTGDSRRMNSNHAVATVIDAWKKGLRGFDLEKAYIASKKGIEEKTLIPWSAAPAGWLDDFYKEHGYIPALKPGEKETVANVSIWEKRQPVAVTLGTAYDQWCLSQIAAERGHADPADAAFDLLVEEQLAVGMISFGLDEADITAIMRHPAVSFITDGLMSGRPHPRAYATYPRILGRYVREQGVLSLEEAVRKMTSLPARKIRLRTKGVIAEGYDADLVVFDPDTVIDKNSYDDPRVHPAGIAHVLVNGVFVVEDAALTGARPGRVIRD